jgi:PRD1 phage membrane DNA delivery
MGDQIISSAVTVMMAIVGLAIIATLVSKNANTTNIIGVTGRSFSGALAAAEAPVLGGFGLNVAGTQAYSGYQF